MNLELDDIQKSFKELFQGSDFKQNDHTIQAWPQKGVMYELIKRGTDTPWYEVRFWLQGRSWNDPLVTKLRKKFSIRDYDFSTYDKNVLWTQRKVVLTVEDLKNDIESILNLLKEIPDLMQNNSSPEELPVKICSNVTAAELLTRELRIPDYQRPYSWLEKNVRDFLVDISLWGDENKSGIPYHLGTIILKEQNSKNGEVYFDVIDGQQRLTTLAIIANNCGKKIPLLKTQKNYTESEIQVLLRARNYIKNSKIEINFEQIELAVVILGQGQPEDLAYTFFSNSNSTGKHLSDYDLLKTHHLRYISNDSEAERFSKRWHDLEKSGKQDEVLQCMLFRLRKWINNESFPLNANNRENRELFYHYKSLDPLRNCFFGDKTPFRFNSLLAGGNEFFSYTEYYRKKYNEFVQYEEIKDLTNALSGHSNGVIFDGIKAIAFLFFCKFGEMYLKEAVYLLSYRLSELRNEYRIDPKYLSNGKQGCIFREITRQLDQVTSIAQFFALLSDVKKRYVETRSGPRASCYWASLHTLMSSLENQNLAIPTIKCERKNEESADK